MSLVRVIARNPDGSSCVVIYPVTKDPDNPLTDAQYHELNANKVQEIDSQLTGKPYLDMENTALPPLAQQDQWRLIDGVLSGTPARS